MDQLETIPTLSIAELRKILSDNEVQDTSKSKEELRSKNYFLQDNNFL